MALIAVLQTLAFWNETAWGLIMLVLQMTAIIIPLMVFLEVLKELNILDKFTTMLGWTVKPFSMSPEAVFPILAGLLFGLVYGAGFIIQASKEGALSKRDLYLVSLFLVINHSMIEDTLLFVAIGAKGLVVIIFRFIASIIITFFVGKYVMKH